jgi:zinc transporter ZupT
LRQTVTPVAMLGRVGSIFLTANAGARPLGAALGAAVATAVGADQAAMACLLLAVAGFVLQAMLITASPVRQLLGLPSRA